MQDEVCSELKEALATFQDRVQHLDTGAMLDEAQALVALARQPRFRDCDARICAHDKLLQIHARIDSVGHARADGALAARLRRQVPPTSGCFACLSSAMARSERAQGQPQRGRRLALEALEALELHPLLQAHHGAPLLQQALLCAPDAPDADAPGLLERIEAFAAMAAQAAQNTDHEIVQRISDNLQEHVREARVLSALAAHGVDAALAAYHDGLHHDAPSPGKLAVQLAVLRRVSQPTPEIEALHHEALAYAMELAYHRRACELALIGLELELDSPGAYLPVLEQHLPALSSRDLHQRAQALGFDPSELLREQ